MWQALTIDEQNYFFQCTVTESNTCFSLYNLKEIWSEECPTSEVIERAKALNKRVSYDNETVMKTLQQNVPTSSTFDPATKSDDGCRKLLLKFNLGRPFNFEWKLRLLGLEGFKKLVTYPLFMSVYYLSEQIKELKDVIKKKDIEIKQYKEEGAVLKRTTVETATFYEDAFDDRFEMVNNVSKGFVNISEKLKPCFPAIEVKNHTKTTTKQSESSKNSSMDRLKRSPMKAKKRKFFEKNRKRMENLLKVQKEKMDYLSSQSQTPPTDELAEIIQSLDELEAKRLASTTL